MSHICAKMRLTSCLVYLAEMMYWFHPLVWLAGAGRSAPSGEQACDDLVVRCGMRADGLRRALVVHRAPSGPAGLEGIMGLAM